MFLIQGFVPPEVKMAHPEAPVDKVNVPLEFSSDTEVLTGYSQADLAIQAQPQGALRGALDSATAKSSDLMSLISNEIRSKPFIAMAVAAILGFACGLRR